MEAEFKKLASATAQAEKKVQEIERLRAELKFSEEMKEIEKLQEEIKFLETVSDGRPLTDAEFARAQAALAEAQKIGLDVKVFDAKSGKRIIYTNKKRPARLSTFYAAF